MSLIVYQSTQCILPAVQLHRLISLLTFSLESGSTINGPYGVIMVISVNM